MMNFDIVIRPDVSAFLIGGRSSPLHGGDRATARDSRGRLIIPASALRGALRIELERLLAGRDPEARRCSANRGEHTDPDHPCDCPVCRLFGDAGVAAGSLRLEDAVLEEAAGEAGEAVVVRPRVAVSRRTRTAAEKLLGFLETSPLLGADRTADDQPVEFRARARLIPRGDAGELADDRRHLEAACATLRGIGGSRARGLGWVRCSIEDRPDEPPAPAPALGSSGGLRLRFTATAPLHLGLGPPLGYFQPSRRWAPGSAVRGALAFALLEHGLCTPDEAAFQRLFGPGSQVSFGSARLAGQVASATRRKCRPVGEGIEHVFDDLVAEVLRQRAAESGLALAVAADCACPMPGCKAVKAMSWEHREDADRPQVRVRTRTAINRRTGTSMDAKLFSHEVLEPEVLNDADPGREPGPLVLTAELWGIEDGACRDLLARLHRREVWLGAKRSQGMGGCRLAIEEAEPVDEAAVLAATAGLGEALTEGWEALRRAASRSLPGILDAGDLPVTVVVSEPWCPEGSAAEGALQALVRRGPLDPGGQPIASFVDLGEEGRFGALEARRYGASSSVHQGEWLPRPVVAPGSTWVYAVDREVLAARLPQWLELGQRGQGLHHEVGWGRFSFRGADTDF